MSKTSKVFGYPDKYLEAMLQDQEGFFDWNLKQANKGDVSSAHELMHGFCSCVEQGRPIHKAIQNYLYKAFRDHLIDGTPIEKSLLLKRPANRPKSVVTVDPIRAISTLYLYIKRDGMGKEEAKLKVSNTMHLSVRNLERFDSQWNLIRNFEISELEQMTEPTIAAKNKG